MSTNRTASSHANITLEFQWELPGQDVSYGTRWALCDKHDSLRYQSEYPFISESYLVCHSDYPIHPVCLLGVPIECPVHLTDVSTTSRTAHSEDVPLSYSEISTLRFTWVPAISQAHRSTLPISLPRAWAIQVFRSSTESCSWC